MVGGVLLLLGVTAASAAGEQLVVGDAYVRSEGATRWLIGTRCVEQVFECAGGQFRLVSYKNRCTQPAIEYVEANAACARPSPWTSMPLRAVSPRRTILVSGS